MLQASKRQKPAIPDGYGDGRCDPNASVFVSANAGSGKTRQLVDRVLGLLLAGVAPGRILCLTYTNAAAAEMRERILAELGRWVMADGEALIGALEQILGRAPDASALKRARALFAETLDAPQGMRIQTLHGFCQSLLKRFPLEAGVPPHFSVMDERTQREMLKEARLQLLEGTHAGEVEEAIRALAQTSGGADFESLTKHIVTHRFAFEALPPDAAGEMFARCGLPGDATEESLLSAHLAGEDADALRDCIPALQRGSKTNQEQADVLSRWLSNPGVAMAGEYLDLFLTDKKTPRDLRRLIKNALDDRQIEALLKAQQRALQFHDARRSLAIASHGAHVIRIAGELFAIYGRIKRAHGRMDYDDLILAARALLTRAGASAWVLYKLDGGIDHILVDEAQDTSPAQWDIVGALTEDFFSGESRSDDARSLFIVGDEKQSIFSFQGADVSQLASAHAHFHARAAAAGKTAYRVELTHSYRSAPEILQAVDAVFQTVHTAHRAEAKGLVEIWPLFTPPPVGGRTGGGRNAGDNNAYPSQPPPQPSPYGGGSISPPSRLASHIADTVRDWVKTGRRRPGDVMILLRTRAGLADRLARALKRRGVPVAGVDRMRLTENLAVQDMLALAQCMLLPDDDLTLAALLKSPIGNFSEEELFTLAHDRGDKSLWQRLQEQGGAAYALLAGLRNKADYLPPYEFFAHALDTLDLRRRFLGRMGAEYADAIDELLSQALAYEQDNVPSLQGFLHWLQTGDSDIKRDMEQSGGEVRIMTVHGAKGLQAPVVILPDTVSTRTPPESLFWHDADGVSLPLWVTSQDNDNALSGDARARKKQAAAEEYRRLLYVAMTRAEDELYICGASGKEKISDECWYSIVKTALEPIAEKAGEMLRIGCTHPIPLPQAGEGAEHREAGEGWGEGDFDFLHRPPPAESSPPKPLAPSRLEGENPPAAPPLSPEIYARGRFIHALLEHLPSLPLELRAQAAKTLAAPYGRIDAGACINEAERIIAGFPQLFSGSMAEVPVAGTITVKGAPFAVSGQIDRLLVGEKEIWIVDYKTNRLPPPSPKETPPVYLRQMALYRRLLQEIYPGKRVACALLWTAAPRMDVLDEAALETYI